MAKKKKKPIQNEKQSRAESYNRFVSGINAMMQKLGVKVRAQDLPAKELKYLFDTKYVSPKLGRKHTQLPKSAIFKEIEHFAPITISEIKIELDGFDELVFLKTIFTDFFDQAYFAIKAIECNIVKDAKSKEKLLDFLDSQTINVNKASHQLTRFFYVITYAYSDFKKFIVWFEYDEKARSKFKASPCFNIMVNEMEVEQKVFLKDRFNRVGKMAYDLVVGNEPETIRIKLKDLGISSNLALVVYIQDHVYDRLQERLDALDIPSAHMELTASLKNIEYVITNRNSKLIVYRYKGKKLGYFTFRIIDDAILLSTFLFLTNDSTPEGEKLKELASLEKEDKKYLKIDKLSAFALSDVRDNPKLVKLFEDAGCGHLFEDEYKPIAREVSFNKIAERIEKYLDREGGFELDEKFMIE